MQLNRLFGEKSIQGTIIEDEERALALLMKVRAGWEKREELQRAFNYANYQGAMYDWTNLTTILFAVQATIPQDLVALESELRTEAELLRHIEELVSRERRQYMVDVTSRALGVMDTDLAKGMNQVQAVRTILEEIYKILRAELETIDRILRDGVNVRDLVLSLSDLIRSERDLYDAFYRKYHRNSTVYKRVLDYAKKLLTGKTPSVPISKEEKLLYSITDSMLKEGSRNKFRELAGAIFTTVVEAIEKEERLRTTEQVANRFTARIADDAFMTDILKKLTKRLSLKRADYPLLIEAFRAARKRGLSEYDYLFKEIASRPNET